MPNAIIAAPVIEEPIDRLALGVHDPRGAEASTTLYFSQRCFAGE